MNGEYLKLNNIITQQATSFPKYRTTLISTISVFVSFVLLTIQPTVANAQSLVPIAVVDFTTSIRNANYTRRLPELIIDELVNSGEFDVLEREKMDSLAGELDFQAGALVDPSKAVQIGGMSGARLIVTGNIIEYGSTKQRSTQYNVTSTVYKYYLKARIEVVDLQSGSKIMSKVADSSATLKKVGLNSVGKGEASLGPDVAKKLVSSIMENKRVRTILDENAPDQPEDPISITITSNPPGADVEIDGVYIGNAGGDFETTPGVHEIIISLPGYNVWKKKVLAKAGMAFKANFTEEVDANVKIEIKEE